MKKALKAIILLPMWPLIWLQERNISSDEDREACGCSRGCYRRAKKMRAWYEAR